MNTQPTEIDPYGDQGLGFTEEGTPITFQGGMDANEYLIPAQPHQAVYKKEFVLLEFIEWADNWGKLLPYSCFRELIPQFTEDKILELQDLNEYLIPPQPHQA